MKKSVYITGEKLTDKQWLKIEPLLPAPVQSRMGGQRRAPNRASLEGILWVLRTARPGPICRLIFHREAHVGGE